MAEADDEVQPLPLPPAEVTDPVDRARWYLEASQRDETAGLPEYMAYLSRAVHETVAALEALRDRP